MQIQLDSLCLPSSNIAGPAVEAHAQSNLKMFTAWLTCWSIDADGVQLKFVVMEDQANMSTVWSHTSVRFGRYEIFSWAGGP